VALRFAHAANSAQLGSTSLWAFPVTDSVEVVAMAVAMAVTEAVAMAVAGAALAGG
jgi:hypothetical protein